MARGPALILAALLTAAGAIAVAPSAPVTSAPTPSSKDVLVLTEKVASWQLDHLGQPVPHQRRETYTPRDWPMGAFFVGLATLADHSKNPRFAATLYKAGEAEGWQLGERLYNADHHVIAQAWIWSYDHKRDPKMIAPVRARFDAVLANQPGNALLFADPVTGVETKCRDRWCWCDALFMGPPGWFALTRATGDGRYAAYADREFWQSADYLFSPEDGLVFRDSRFFAKPGPHGERIFWARGNGWVYAALARIIDILPSLSPQRQRYVDLFVKMSDALVKSQKPDGYWAVSMLDPAPDTLPETSGTGFFTYGLAWGVQHGILKDPRYRAAALRGWSALARSVDDSGRLGYVQPIGSAPDLVGKEDTQPFGVGAFLLAGTAVSEMQKSR